MGRYRGSSAVRRGSGWCHVLGQRRQGYVAEKSSGPPNDIFPRWFSPPRHGTYTFFLANRSNISQSFCFVFNRLRWQLIADRNEWPNNSSLFFFFWTRRCDVTGQKLLRSNKFIIRFALYLDILKTERILQFWDKRTLSRLSFPFFKRRRHGRTWIGAFRSSNVEGSDSRHLARTWTIIKRMETIKFHYANDNH